MDTFITALPRFVVLVFSIMIHEVAHGAVALWRGDTTARDAGRLTLNPLPHIDLFGTILIPLFLILTRAGFLFGWAKPVPTNPYFYRTPRKDLALIGAAGPLSNFLLAVLAGVAFRILGPAVGMYHPLSQALLFAVVINLVLCFFNLVPIPPLDGSRILVIFLSRSMAETYVRIEPYGMFIIIILLMLGFFRLILPLINLFLSLLTGLSL